MYSIKAKGNKTGEVLIYEEVGGGFFGGVSAKQFTDDLKALGDVTQIDLRIACLGGDVNDGLAIYRQLVEHKARIVVHVDGTAASIASVIAMAGDEIIIAETGSMMIHEAWVITYGNAAELRKTAERCEATSAQMADVYTARSKKPAKQVREWMAATTWFYGQEAVDAGFADSVAENMRVAAMDSSLWNSQILGRMALNLKPEQLAPKPHAGNEPERARLAALTTRMRARHLSHVK